MNGIKCYLSRTEVKKILADDIARRLEPERLLGACVKEATLYDDGRVEVMFWTPDSALGPPAESPRDGPPSDAVPRLFTVSRGR